MTTMTMTTRSPQRTVAAIPPTGATIPPLPSCVASLQEVYDLLAPLYGLLMDFARPNAERANDLYALLLNRLPFHVTVRDCAIDDAAVEASFTIEDGFVGWSIPYSISWQ